MGDQHYKQGEEGAAHHQRPRGADPAGGTERYQEEARWSHWVRHRLRAARLHPGESIMQSLAMRK